MFNYENESYIIQQRNNEIILKNKIQNKITKFDYIEFFDACMFNLGLCEEYQKLYIRYFINQYGVYEKEKDIFRKFDINIDVPELCKDYFVNEIEKNGMI